MKIKIVADGTPRGTKLYWEDGELIEGVTSVTFTHEVARKWCDEFQGVGATERANPWDLYSMLKYWVGDK